jgi:hypothetical protein
MAHSVIVTNISLMLEESHLRELFGCCGDIKSLALAGAGPDRTCTVEFEKVGRVQVRKSVVQVRESGSVSGGLVFHS